MKVTEGVRIWLKATIIDDRKHSINTKIDLDRKNLPVEK